MRFFPGEVVEHIRWGMDVTILSKLELASIRSLSRGTTRLASAHLVECSDGRLNPHGKNEWAAEPKDLRRKRPPQELGSWDNCVWKPKEMSCCS